LTPVAGLFLTRFGFEKIFKTHGIFKTQESALLVLRKGAMNLPHQSLVNQYFSQKIGDYYWSSPWFSNKQHYLSVKERNVG